MGEADASGAQGEGPSTCQSTRRRPGRQRLVSDDTIDDFVLRLTEESLQFDRCFIALYLYFRYYEACECDLLILTILVIVSKAWYFFLLKLHKISDRVPHSFQLSLSG